MRTSSRHLSLALVGAALAAAPAARAVTYTFTKTSPNGGYAVWSTSGNWSGGTKPTVGGAYTDALVIGAANTSTYYSVMDYSTAFQKMASLNLQATGSTYLDGGALSLAGNAMVTSKSLQSDSYISNALGLNGNGIANANTTFTVSTYLTLNGALSGNSSLTKTGVGDLVLKAANTYTGTTTVTGGSLQVAAANALPSTSALSLNTSTSGGGLVLSGYDATVAGLSGTATSAIVLGSNTLTVNQASGTTGVYFGNLTGAGKLTVSGAGTLQLAGGSSTSTYTGATTVTSGTLQLGHANATSASSALVVNGGAFDLNNYSTIVADLSGTGGTVSLGSGTLTVNQTGNTTYAGAISGSGSLTKSGNGSLTLTGANTSAGTTTVNGGSLVLGKGSALPSTATVVVNGGTLDLKNISRAVGSLSGSGVLSTVSLGSAALTVDQSGDTTYSGAITGTGSLTKSGAGSLTLSGSNSYAGTTTVNAGTLVLGTASALPTTAAVVVNGGTLSLNNASRTVGSLAGTSGAVSLGSGTLTVNQAGNTTYAGAITGTGTFTKSGNGALTLTGALSYSGRTTISGGTLVVPGLSGDYTDNAALTVNQSGGATYSGAITGTGSLTKSGNGILTLTGANTYAGGTTISGGGLYVSSLIGDYTNNGALTLNLNGSATYSGAISGTGNFNFNRNSAGTLTLTGTNTYTGLTTINAGTLSLGSVNALPDMARVLVYGTLDLNNVSRTVGLLFGGPNGIIALGSATLTVDQADTYNYTYGGAITGTGGLTKSGVGSLTLSGTNAYSGMTTVGAGILKAGAANALSGASAVAVNNGTLDLSGYDQTIGGLSGAGGTVSLGSAALTDSQTENTTYGGTIIGTGSLVKSGAGALTLTAANSYTGGTTVSGGRLIVSKMTGTSYVDNAALEVNSAADLSYGNAISGSGSLTKSGDGLLSLSGNLTYTGGTTVSGGTLRIASPTGFPTGSLAVADGAALQNSTGGTLTVAGPTTVNGTVETGLGSTTLFTGAVHGAGSFTGAGTVEFDGAYSPGNSPAAVSFAGGFALGASDDLTMELAGTTLGSEYDHLTIGGLAHLGGTLNVTMLGGFSPSLGNSFDLFDYTGLPVGTFSTVNLPTLGNGLKWNTSALYTTGTVSAQAVPEPASVAALAVGALGLLRRRRK